jgi:hypothetical protein
LLPGLDVVEAADPPDLADVAVHAALHLLRGQAVAQVARAEAQEVRAPGLDVLAALEAQRRQRDLQLHHEAGVGDPAGRIPDAVPAVVLVAGGVVDHQVHLRAERVDEELVGTTLVVEGVEHHADEVVVVGGVAIAQEGADLLRVRILGDEGDQHVLAVFGDIGGGLHVGRGVLGRARLDAEVDLGGLRPEGSSITPSIFASPSTCGMSTAAGRTGREPPSAASAGAAVASRARHRLAARARRAGRGAAIGGFGLMGLDFGARKGGASLN